MLESTTSPRSGTHNLATGIVAESGSFQVRSCIHTSRRIRVEYKRPLDPLPAWGEESEAGWLRLLLHVQDLHQRLPENTAGMCSIKEHYAQKLYRLHTAILYWPLSSAATMEVQGPDTTGRRIQGLLFLASWWYMGTICIF